MKAFIYFVLIMLVAGIILAPRLVRAAEVTAVGDYAIDWWTLDGGSQKSSAEQYTLWGTIGQPDIGKLGGDGFSLHGGFWVRGILNLLRTYIYLPLIIK